MKFIGPYITCIVLVVVSGCNSNELENLKLDTSEKFAELDSNYWIPDKLILNDTSIDISSLNQLYRFDDEKVLVWNILNDSLMHMSEFLDIQVWWVELNDSLLFPLNTTEYFDTSRLDGKYYHIPKVIRPDSSLQKGYSDIEGEVVIERIYVSRSASDNLIKLTKTKAGEPIGMN